MSEIVEEAWKPQQFWARKRAGRSAMTVHPLFERLSVGPDEINRFDAMTRIVARAIIESAKPA
jgi:hypothetical protein